MKNIFLKKLICIAFCVLFTNLFSKGSQSILLGEYKQKLEDTKHAFSDTCFAHVKLSKIENERYLLVCDIFTHRIMDDITSSWFFKKIDSIENGSGKWPSVVLCKKDDEEISIVTFFLKRYTKSINYHIALFEDLFDSNQRRYYELFFRIHSTFTKGFVSYSYMMYSKDKNLCYEKFSEIFGTDALEKFKENITK